MRSHVQHLVVIVALAVLGACATPPAGSGSAPGSSASSSAAVQAPRTFKEWLATGYALNASVRRLAAAGLDAKRIDAGDGRRVLADTDSARTVLDEARKLESVDPSSAMGKVQYAVGILRAGEKLLNDRGVR